jgi:outer membrane protein TolC
MSSDQRRVIDRQICFGRILRAFCIVSFLCSAHSVSAEEKGEPVFLSPLGDDGNDTLPVTNRPEPKPIQTADPLGPTKSSAETKAADPIAPRTGTAGPVTGDNPKGLYVSLDDALEYAVLNNLGLKLARLNDRGSDINVRVAWSVYFPEFNAGISHSGSRPVGGSAESGTTLTGGFTQRSPWGTQLDFALSETHNNSFNSENTTGNASARITQPLWKGFGTDVGLADIRTARINRLISRGNLELQVQQLIFSVRSAYADIIRQIQNSAVNEQSVRSATTFLELSKAREQAGQVTRLDVFNAEVQLRSRELDLITNKRQLETAYDRLKQFMDVELSETIWVDAPTVDFGETSETEKAATKVKERERSAVVDEAKRKAREQAKAEGKTDAEADDASKAAERRARAAVDLEERKNAPAGTISKVIDSDKQSGTVNLVVRREAEVIETKILFQATHFDEAVVLKESLDNRIDLLINSRQLAIQRLQTLLAKDGLGYQIDLVSSFNRNHNQRSFVESDNGLEINNWTVGVNAAIPWGKIRDRAAYERSLLDLERAEIDLKRVRVQVQFEVRDIIRSLREAETSLLIEGQRVEQAKKSVEAAQISFDRGLKDSFDVIRAEDDLLRAKTAFINRKLDYVVQLARLETVVGKPTGRVDLSGQSVGGLIDARLPPAFRDTASKAQPEPEKRPEQDPFNKSREYRKDYKPSKSGPVILDHNHHEFKK